MRTHDERWGQRHMQAMYVLQRTHLKAARAWRMRTALRKVYEAAAQAQCEEEGKQAALGFRNTENIIAIAYLRMSKLAH